VANLLLASWNGANLLAGVLQIDMAEITIDRIIRSKRRTISLLVTAEARLVVYAPFRTPLHYIKTVVTKKSSWIRQKQELLKERCRRNPPKEFVSGEAFLFLGISYPLRLVGDIMDIELEGSLKVPGHLLPDIKQALIDWYRKQAITRISERVEWFAHLTHLQYRSVKITNASRRLGSCGHKGTLNFSWRLIMAPPGVVDYVVVHELSHLVHMNHSPRFWNKVMSIMPDYADKKRWLKENHYLLDI